MRRGDAGYPTSLQDLADPPEILHGFGERDCLGPGVAIVGSRRATPYGLRCAEILAARVAERGIGVVSGAATGCDARAQRAALAAGGRSVAVLGCGADLDYPSSSAGLLADLRSGRGAVISELPWGMPALRWAFPRRNRIIAALARALIVVEAALPSGTSITVAHALEMDREVCAVPGSIFHERTAGCNQLIRDGACPITCVEDLDVLLDRLFLPIPAPRSDLATAQARGDRVLDAALAGPIGLDELVEATGLPVAEVLARLSAGERDGHVARYPDGRYGPG